MSDDTGGRECSLDAASDAVSTAIEAATAYARRDLGFDELVVRLFEPGPPERAGETTVWVCESKRARRQKARVG